MLKLIPADVGRSITDLRPDVEVPELEALISGVINSLTSKDVEVQDRGGHWYSLQIRPYETADNKITGAVLILFDINAAKLAAERSKMLTSYAEAFVETVRNCVLELDGSLRVERATPFFYKDFQLTPNETEGRSIFEIGNGQWDIPELRTLLEQRLVQNPKVKDYELEHDFARVGRKKLLLNLLRIETLDGDDSRILISIGER
jgi:two-component system CheB/CheR fusion protein